MRAASMCKAVCIVLYVRYGLLDIVVQNNYWTTQSSLSFWVNDYQQLCCTGTATLQWTRHVDMWQILKNAHERLYDRSVRAT